jgi:uncharacterized protein involved in response to NO
MTDKKFALFELGFRPFYLLAAFWSIFTIIEWLLELKGIGIRQFNFIPGMQWHAHEMIFGFAATVVTGFALTAVRAWTGLDTPKSIPLLLLTLLWIIGRIGALTGSILIVFDIIFLPIVAIITGRLLLKRKMYRNLFLPLILTTLGILNAGFYLSGLVFLNTDSNILLFASLYLIVMIEIMIGNRIIPSFTANAVIGLSQFRNATLTKLTIMSSALTFLCIITGFNGIVSSVACFVTAFMHSILLWGWRPLATQGKPLLWILHISYGWIPVGFLLMGLSHLGIMSIYPALHVFGIGVTGGLIISMITRTALGHTGRPLKIGSIELASYLCIQGALIIWLLSGLSNNSWFYPLLVVAGALWCTTFGLYIYKYAPLLIYRRPDGKSG